MAEKREQTQESPVNASPQGQQPARRREMPLELRRALRHESRTSQTYASFIKRLCERGGMSPSVAEQAAVSVLCALEQRIYGTEVSDLEAQLPQKLTELLHRCERHEGPPPRKFGREELLRMVGEDLALRPDVVEPVVRAVFAVVRERISEGEAEDVMNQLPADLRDLWGQAV
jgi:uncharacterized protein (DUF2267 family)